MWLEGFVDLLTRSVGPVSLNQSAWRATLPMVLGKSPRNHCSTITMTTPAQAVVARIAKTSGTEVSYV